MWDCGQRPRENGDMSGVRNCIPYGGPGVNSILTYLITFTK